MLLQLTCQEATISPILGVKRDKLLATTLGGLGMIVMEDEEEEEENKEEEETAERQDDEEATNTVVVGQTQVAGATIDIDEEEGTISVDEGDGMCVVD